MNSLKQAQDEKKDALFNAIINRNSEKIIEEAQDMLDYNICAEKNYSSVSCVGKTPLMVALEQSGTASIAGRADAGGEGAAQTSTITEECLIFLIENMPENFNTKVDMEGQSALIYAIKHASHTVCRHIIMKIGAESFNQMLAKPAAGDNTLAHFIERDLCYGDEEESTGEEEDESSASLGYVGSVFDALSGVEDGGDVSSDFSQLHSIFENALLRENNGGGSSLLHNLCHVLIQENPLSPYVKCRVLTALGLVEKEGSLLESSDFWIALLKLDGHTLASIHLFNERIVFCRKHGIDRAFPSGPSVTEKGGNTLFHVFVQRAIDNSAFKTALAQVNPRVKGSILNGMKHMVAVRNAAGETPLQLLVKVSFSSDGNFKAFTTFLNGMADKSLDHDHFIDLLATCITLNNLEMMNVLIQLSRLSSVPITGEDLSGVLSTAVRSACEHVRTVAAQTASRESVGKTINPMLPPLSIGYRQTHMYRFSRRSKTHFIESDNLFFTESFLTKHQAHLNMIELLNGFLNHLELGMNEDILRESVLREINSLLQLAVGQEMKKVSKRLFLPANFRTRKPASDWHFNQPSVQIPSRAAEIMAILLSTSELPLLVGKRSQFNASLWCVDVPKGAADGAFSSSCPFDLSSKLNPLAFVYCFLPSDSKLFKSFPFKLWIQACVKGDDALLKNMLFHWAVGRRYDALSQQFIESLQAHYGHKRITQLLNEPVVLSDYGIDLEQKSNTKNWFSIDRRHRDSDVGSHPSMRLKGSFSPTTVTWAIRTPWSSLMNDRAADDPYSYLELMLIVKDTDHAQKKDRASYGDRSRVACAVSHNQTDISHFDAIVAAIVAGAKCPKQFVARSHAERTYNVNLHEYLEYYSSSLAYSLRAEKYYPILPGKLAAALYDRFDTLNGFLSKSAPGAEAGGAEAGGAEAGGAEAGGAAAAASAGGAAAKDDSAGSASADSDCVLNEKQRCVLSMLRLLRAMIFIQIREEHQKKRTECSGLLGMLSGETKDSVTLWRALSEWAKKIEPKSAKEQEDDLMSGLKLTQAYKQYGGEGQNRIAALAWLPEEERHRKMLAKMPVTDGVKGHALYSSKEELLALACTVIDREKEGMEMEVMTTLEAGGHDDPDYDVEGRLGFGCGGC
jgi:hypothetical protein